MHILQQHMYTYGVDVNNASPRHVMSLHWTPQLFPREKQSKRGSRALMRDSIVISRWSLLVAVIPLAGCNDANVGFPLNIDVYWIARTFDRVYIWMPTRGGGYIYQLWRRMCTLLEMNESPLFDYVRFDWSMCRPGRRYILPPPLTFVLCVCVCVCLCLAEGSLLALMTTIITLTHTMTSLPSQDEVGNGGENWRRYTREMTDLTVVFSFISSSHFLLYPRHISRKV